MTLTVAQFLIVCPLALLAGFVDSIAGGGGMISLPAYYLAGLPPALASGTNKLSAMYDETAVVRLRQILILRKLRIPLKQIQRILQSPDAAVAIDVFRRNIAEADTAVAALTTIRNILQTLVERLEQSADVHVRALVTEDEEVLAAIASLVPPTLNDKEGNDMARWITRSGRTRRCTGA